MTANVGSLDRAVRIVIGVALLSLLYYVDGPNRWWGLIGLMPLGTALFRWCPAYTPFGISTAKAE
jgi:Protein of unknown function (DUF2892)